MARNYKKGYYEPVNKEKLINASKLTYRSSWELESMKFFDRSPRILKWGSECMQIPYFSSVKGRMARYFVDFVITYQDKDGNLVTELIEVKPYDQVNPPKKNKNTKTYQEAMLTYITNQEKWASATKYCEERGWKFRILTENQIFKG